MIQARTCPRCQAELPAGVAADNACPRCLLLLGIDDGGTGDGVGTDPYRAATPPEPSPRAEAALSGRRLGGYLVGELLGGGGMGQVYAAQDLRLGRTVALKVLPPEMAADPDRVARFRREARALAALNHPGIVTIHAIEEEEGLHFLIMERVEGETLAERRSRGALPTEGVLAIAVPLAEALRAAHDAGVVHRDLKPANVMIDAEGRVKLVDFGLARAEATLQADDRSLTGQGVIVGTLPYLSPEQVQGKRADRASDQFSFGVLLFELVTGRRPFQGETQAELLASILRDDPPRLRSLRPDVSVSLDEVVDRCLRKAPERRFPDLAAVLEALRGAGSGVTAGGPGTGPARQPPAVPWGIPGSGSFPALPSGIGPPVGRAAELARLEGWLTEALASSRRTVFVTGDPGLGKTTLVGTFVADALARHEVWLGHGQCLERQGPGEAYMPVFEALGRMCRADGGHGLVALLARIAPSWLVQMPTLVSDEELAILERRSLGVTPDRMLREMVEALEALSRERPIVLVLEDLHWSDYSTLDLVAWLARRPDPARLLLVGTFRPADVHSGEHPLHRVVQDLLSRAGRQCFELPLDLLDGAAVAAYLESRFPGAEVPERLAQALHRRTDGNPLFVEAVVGSWIDRGLAVEEDGRWRLSPEVESAGIDVPPTLRTMIERQLDALAPEDRELLEAASVAGTRFAAAALAGALEATTEEVEDRSVDLAASSRFLRARGSEEWPDGTLSARFGFAHDLYQQVAYERLPAARRARLHRQIGEGLRQAYRAEPREHAAELAVHFVHGRAAPSAVEYLQLAAEHSLSRSAYREAIDHLGRALELVPRLPDEAARLRGELALQGLLAPALIAVEGFSAPSVETSYRRAQELGERLADPEALSPVLYGLATLRELRGQYHEAERLLVERLRLPEGADRDNAPLESHELLACSTFHQGRFSEALEHARTGLGLFAPERHRALLVRENLGVSCHDWAGLALWFLGFPDRAVEEAKRAIALARKIEHPYSESHAHGQAAVVYQCRRESEPTRRAAQATLDLAREQGFPFRIATGEIHLGWATAALGEPAAGIERIRSGLDLYRRIGAEMDRPFYLTLLAEALGLAGRPEEARDTLEEAAAEAPVSREYFYEAEFHRLRGWLAGSSGRPEEAEGWFRRAVEVAERQGARSLELRAAVDLAELLAGRGDGAAAIRRLAELYRGFEEGLDTVDLRRAGDLVRAAEEAG